MSLSILATIRDKYRGVNDGRFDRYTDRFADYGAFAVHRMQTESPTGIINRIDKEQLQSSFGIDFTKDVLKHENGVVGTTRSCTVADTKLESAVVDFTFNTYVISYQVPLRMFKNNRIDVESYIMKREKQNKIALLEAINADALANIEAGKNQFWTNIAPTILPQVGDTLQLETQPNGDDNLGLYNYIPTVMKQAKFRDGVDILHTINEETYVQKYMQFRTQNAEDRARMFVENDFRFFADTDFIGAADAPSLYAINRDSLAVWYRNPHEYMNGGISVSEGHDYFEEFVPELGFPMAVRTYSGCATDAATRWGDDETPTPYTGASGSDPYIGVEMSIELTFARAYVEDLATEYSPIMKFERIPPTP